MQPVIPLRSMKRKPKPGLPRLFDRPKYRQRNIIERMFGWLKKNRRIGYRYDKLVTSFLAMVSLAARCGVYDIIFSILPVGENLDTDKYSYLCKIISYAQVNC